MEFWLRVKDIIKQQNTTQEWVAKESGVSFRTFQGWISKNRLPDIAEAIAIAKALQSSVEYLATGTEPKMQHKRIEIQRVIDLLEPLDREQALLVEGAVRQFVKTEFKL